MIADRPVLCPVLVGRDEQLRVLQGLLGVQPNPGSGPRTVVISGEAGIGKSRLLTELDQLAVQQGLRVVRGRAFEGGRGLPFGLLLDLLRSLLTSAWREEAILRLDRRPCRPHPAHARACRLAGRPLPRTAAVRRRSDSTCARRSDPSD